MYTHEQLKLKTEIIAHLEGIKRAANELTQALLYEPETGAQFVLITDDMAAMARHVEQYSIKMLSLSMLSVNNTHFYN